MGVVASIRWWGFPSILALLLKKILILISQGPEAHVFWLDNCEYPDVSRREVGIGFTAPSLWYTHPILSQCTIWQGVDANDIQDPHRYVSTLCCYCEGVYPAVEPQTSLKCACLGTGQHLGAFIPLLFKLKCPPRFKQDCVMTGTGYNSFSWAGNVAQW